MTTLASFKRVVAVDFEFGGNEGDTPQVRCMVAKDLYSGQTFRFWEDELHRMDAAPFPVDGSTLWIAHYSSAEWNCFHALGWELPARVLDTFVEFRNMTNGLHLTSGAGLLGALSFFGIDGIDSREKDAMRDLALRGGPYTADERRVLLDYCESDVLALEKLLPRMEPYLDLPRALLRGRYMKAAATIEFNGIPIETETLRRFRKHWGGIQNRLVERVDAQYGVFEAKEITQ
jgi:hypothetical protein